MNYYAAVIRGSLVVAAETTQGVRRTQTYYPAQPSESVLPGEELFPVTPEKFCTITGSIVLLKDGRDTNPISP